MTASTFKVRACLLALAVVIPAAFLVRADPPMPAEPPAINHPVMEAYPSRLQARMELQERSHRALPSIGGHSPAFVMTITKRWQPAQAVRVAFKGGDDGLYKKIQDDTTDWTNQANLKLDFKDGNKYRTWTTTDNDFAAEIRVSFDQVGYYSLVGTDSINRTVTRPGEESMNFQGFDQLLPSDWRGVVLHEFGHALGLQHEHQHPTQGCDADFRWDDDQGYTPTTDSFGQYIADPSGKRPGIYTVLGGPPNNWPKSMVDFNLKQLPESHPSEFWTSDFDKLSIMKYYFPAWMFVQGEASHCFSVGENLTLSPTDIKGIKQAYPQDMAAITVLKDQRTQFLEGLIKVEGLSSESHKHYQAQLDLMLAPK